MVALVVLTAELGIRLGSDDRGVKSTKVAKTVLTDIAFALYPHATSSAEGVRSIAVERENN